MNTSVLQPGQTFPNIIVNNLGGGSINIGRPQVGHEWKLVVVYRGNHCPLCTQYLKKINEHLDEFSALGVDVVAVSADSKARAVHQMTEVNPKYAVGYDLGVEQMRELGLFISSPRLGMDAERPFAEPALFVINQKGTVQMIDQSNVPFARPDPSAMVMGIRYYRGLNGQHSINGSYA